MLEQLKKTKSAFLVFLRMYARGIGEYRAEFFGTGLFMVVTNSIFFFTLLFLANKYGSFGDLTPAEFTAALATGVFAFLIGGNFFVGPKKLGERIFSGKLDSMLLRPMPLFIQTQLIAFNKPAMGEIIFGIIFGFFVEPTFWPKIILFAITGAIIVNVWTYCIGLLTIYTDVVHGRGAFDAFINLHLYPTKIFDPIVQFIALFIIPGGMMSFVPYYAPKMPILWPIYFGFIILLCIFAYNLNKKSLIKYTGAS